MISPIKVSSPSEHLAHLAESQKDFIRVRAANDLRLGNKPMLVLPNGVTLLAVLQTYAFDRREDPDGSFGLGLEHTGLRSEVARTIAGRLGLKFDGPRPTFEQNIEGHRRSMQRIV